MIEPPGEHDQPGARAYPPGASRPAADDERDSRQSDLQHDLEVVLRQAPRTRSWLVRSGLASQRDVEQVLDQWLAHGRLVTITLLTHNRMGVLRQAHLLTLAAEHLPASGSSEPDVDSPQLPSWPGTRLTAARQRLGWSLRDLSRNTGIDRAQLARWEHAEVPAAWVEHLQSALAHASPSDAPHRPAQRRSQEDLRHAAKDLICREPGLTRSRVTARLAGTSMARRRAIVEDLVRTGQVLEQREAVEYADGRVLRLRVLRCP